MLNARFPAIAVGAMSTSKVKRSGAALVIRRLETPSGGSISICDLRTCVRFKKNADEVTVNVGEVPALMLLGDTLMGWACATEMKNDRTAVATRPTSGGIFTFAITIVPPFRRRTR
jgi:hypothetical protein